MVSKPGLTISVIDPDPHYLGIDLHAASDRFSGTARVLARLNDLSTLASRIAGFPNGPTDTREYELADGAGGCVSLSFQCLAATGASVVEVALQDDPDHHSPAFARFSFSVVAGDVDRFVGQLRKTERLREGTAVLPAAA